MGSALHIYYDNQRIVPAPTISISKEFIYANDVITGYNYIFSINGYASSLNTKNGNTASSLKNTVESLDDIQNILHKNGKILRFFCPDSSTNLITAYGGHLRSFDVSETENKWTNYARYSAQLEFTRVVFAGNGDYSSNIEIAEDSYGGGLGAYDTTVELVKLKNYNDKWDFSVSEEDLYKYYIGKENKIEDYTQIQVEYTISATGKHYYYDNELTKPAWVVAKEFVQKKLYDQISMFKTSSPLGYFNFPNTNYNSNETDGLPPLNQATSTTSVVAHPILSSSLAAAYKIFNEKILCSSSQTDGTFSATYSCILKYFNNADYGMDFATHSFDVSYDKTRNFDSNTTTITVNGTITGLLLTDILSSAADGNIFQLPNSGPFLYTVTDVGTKYFNALTSFNQFIADATHTDLKDSIKQQLDINYQTLFPDTSGNSCVGQLNLALAEPKSFSISHNYSEGSITYTAEYDNERSCAAERGFESLTITEEDPVPIVAEFIVPGRSGGPIIQSLGSYTHKKVTLEFTGVTKKGCVNGTPWAPNFSGEGVCDTDSYVNMPEKVDLMISQTEQSALDSKQKLIATSFSKNYNPIDGSYSLNKTYLVCPYHP